MSVILRSVHRFYRRPRHRPRLVLWGGGRRDWTVGHEPTTLTVSPRGAVPRGVQWVTIHGAGSRWVYLP